MKRFSRRPLTMFSRAALCASETLLAQRHAQRWNSRPCAQRREEQDACDCSDVQGDVQRTGPGRAQYVPLRRPCGSARVDLEWRRAWRSSSVALALRECLATLRWRVYQPRPEPLDGRRWSFTTTALTHRTLVPAGGRAAGADHGHRRRLRGRHSRAFLPSTGPLRCRPRSRCPDIRLPGHRRVAQGQAPQHAMAWMTGAVSHIAAALRTAAASFPDLPIAAVAHSVGTRFGAAPGATKLARVVFLVRIRLLVFPLLHGQVARAALPDVARVDARRHSPGRLLPGARPDW